MNRVRRKFGLSIVIGGAVSAVLALASGPAYSQSKGELNLYSARHYNTDEKLYSNFTKATGIKINRIEADADPLIQRMKAEGDKSPGVLMASGYIAGGAIAGIGIAFLAGVWEKTDAALQRWGESSNPFYGGPQADLLALIPFAALVVLLLLVGREKLLAGGRGDGVSR